MRGRATVFILLLWLGAFWLIQRAPDTVSSASTPAPLVVIDPGHGGRDPGAVRSGVFEKAINLAVSQKLGNLLQQRGLRVFYTRTRDQSLATTVVGDLQQRSALANRLGATLFVSIHVNIEPSGTVSGPIVYYARGSMASLTLANVVTGSLAPAVGIYHAPRPIGQWVLTHSYMPGINVEIGFLSHSHDAARLQTTPYQSVLAAAIAQGITRYLGH